MLPLKQTGDEALLKSPTVEKCLVLKRIGQEDVPMTEGRDVWWHDEINKVQAGAGPEIMDAEDELFILYTSAFKKKKSEGLEHDSKKFII